MFDGACRALCTRELLKATAKAVQRTFQADQVRCPRVSLRCIALFPSLSSDSRQVQFLCSRCSVAMSEAMRVLPLHLIQCGSLPPSVMRPRCCPSEGAELCRRNAALLCSAFPPLPAAAQGDTPAKGARRALAQCRSVALCMSRCTPPPPPSAHRLCHLLCSA